MAEGQNYRALFERLASVAIRCQIVYAEGVAVDCVFLEVNGMITLHLPDIVVGHRASVQAPAFLRSPAFAAFVRVVETGVAERFDARGSMLTQQWFHFAVDRSGSDQIIALIDDVSARKRAQSRLEAQYAISRTLANSSDLADGIPGIFEALAICEGVAFGAIWLADPGAAQLRFIGAWHAPGLDPDALIAATRAMCHTPGIGMAGQVWVTGEHQIIDDLSTDPSYLQAAAATSIGLTAARALPIRYQDIVIGVVEMLWHLPPHHDPERRDLDESIGHQLGQFVERTRAETDLRRLNLELEQRVAERTADLLLSNAQLEAFSYSVAHDLRAPLRAINGFATVLLEDHAAHLPGDAERMLRTIRDRGTRMGSLIDDLLVVARLDQHQLERDVVAVELLAREIVAALTEGSHARVTIGELPKTEGDASLVRQLLTHLVSNALKFSRVRAQPEIEIGFADGAYLVRDNGVGFDMRYVNKLFGVFQRLHTEAEFEGIGVGLAIVKRIVERHQGRVWAEGEIDRGACIYFTLAAT